MVEQIIFDNCTNDETPVVQIFHKSDNDIIQDLSKDCDESQFEDIEGEFYDRAFFIKKLQMIAGPRLDVAMDAHTYSEDEFLELYRDQIETFMAIQQNHIVDEINEALQEGMPGLIQ